MGQLSGYITLIDVSDGAPGLNNAIIYLYKRATSTPSNMPTGNLTYTFSTNTITAVEAGSSLNGWVQDISTLSGNNTLYFIAATASSTTDTDIIADTEWQGPTLLAESGDDGFNQAIIYLYQRSDETPNKPAGNLTYTFSTGILSGSLGNWTREIPSNSSGNPCYVITAAAISRESTDTIVTNDWSTPIILVEDGTDGISPTVTATATGVKIVDADGNETYINNGSNGDTYYTYIRYSANADGSNYQTTPDPSRPYIGVYSGMESSPPAYDDSGWTWSEYLGTDGVSVTGVKEVYFLKRTTDSVPNKPSDGTAITSTSTNPNVWTTVVPTYINGATYYISIQTSLSAGISPVFSTPVVNQALTSANANAFEALNKVQAKYATSTTSAATAAKVATINPAVDSWSLFNGAEIFVKFTNKNTATSNLTLSIKPSSTGTGTTAAGIRDANGDTLAADFYWKDNALVHFVYDGTYWRVLDITEKYNKLVSDINGLSSTVGQHTTSIGSLGTRVDTAETNITQNATSITSLASNQSTYTKPDGTTGTNTIASAISQNASDILLKVSETDFTGNNIVSKINLNSTTATISAERVNIEGAAIFTGSGRLSETSLNNTYDENGAAAAVAATIPDDISDLNDSTGIIPTNVSDLTNDSGYQTASDISELIISATTLYYASNSATAPSKPTTHVTRNNTNTKGAWNIALPTYDASYPYLYTCIEYKTKNNTYSWSSVEQSTYTSAISNIKTTADAAAPKTSAVYRTQRIYYRKTTTGAPSANTTWLASSGTGYGNWSLSIPQLTNSSNIKYPYLYTAIQTQTVEQYNNGTSCSCSTVLLDDSMTVIDGGTITTGKIAANRLSVGDWTIAEPNGTYGGAIYTGTMGTSNGVIMSPGFTSGISIGSWSPSTDTPTQTWFITAGENFGVTNNGFVYASNVNISGVINATSGQIGGWNLENNLGTYGGALYTGNFGESGGIFITPEFTSTKSIGGAIDKSWTIVAGNKFGITTDGAVYMNDINIGGLREDNLKITTTDISNAVALADRLGNVTTVEQKAYTLTKDASPQSGKVYYTINENNSYQQFSGDTFNVGINYYEKVNNKKLSIHSYGEESYNYIQVAIDIDLEGLSFIQKPIRLSGEPQEVGHIDAKLDGIFHINKLQPNNLIFGNLEIIEYNGIALRRRN